METIYSCNRCGKQFTKREYNMWFAKEIIDTPINVILNDDKKEIMKIYLCPDCIIRLDYWFCDGKYKKSDENVELKQ